MPLQNVLLYATICYHASKCCPICFRNLQDLWRTLRFLGRTMTYPNRRSFSTPHLFFWGSLCTVRTPLPPMPGSERSCHVMSYVSKFQGMKEFMNWKVIDTEILPDNPMSLSSNKLSCLNVFDNKYQYWINNPTASKENDHWFWVP